MAVTQESSWRCRCGLESSFLFPGAHFLTLGPLGSPLDNTMMTNPSAKGPILVGETWVARSAALYSPKGSWVSVLLRAGACLLNSMCSVRFEIHGGFRMEAEAFFYKEID